MTLYITAMRHCTCCMGVITSVTTMNIDCNALAHHMLRFTYFGTMWGTIGNTSAPSVVPRHFRRWRLEHPHRRGWRYTLFVTISHSSASLVIHVSNDVKCLGRLGTTTAIFASLSRSQIAPLVTAGDTNHVLDRPFNQCAWYLSAHNGGSCTMHRWKRR